MATSATCKLPLPPPLPVPQRTISTPSLTPPLLLLSNTVHPHASNQFLHRTRQPRSIRLIPNTESNAPIHIPSISLMPCETVYLCYTHHHISNNTPSIEQGGRDRREEETHRAVIARAVGAAVASPRFSAAAVAHCCDVLVSRFVESIESIGLVFAVLMSKSKSDEMRSGE